MARHNCEGCKFADWERTTTGRLHPSGDGQCRYNYKLPQLPGSMFWPHDREPEPLGGRINRREKLWHPCGLFQPEPRK